MYAAVDRHIRLFLSRLGGWLLPGGNFFPKDVLALHSPVSTRGAKLHLLSPGREKQPLAIGAKSPRQFSVHCQVAPVAQSRTRFERSGKHSRGRRCTATRKSA